MSIGSLVPGSKVAVEVFDAIRKKVNPKDLKAVEDAIGTPQTQKSTVANRETSGDNTGIGVSNRTLSQGKIDEILVMPKGSRPDPSTYMSKADIDALFEDWRNRGVDLSRVSGAFFAAAAGGDAQLGAQTGANAAENNILPAVFLVARLGFMAYTMYELYETGKKVYNLVERYQSGEEISDEELQSAAIEVGIELTVGVAISRFKLLEKIVSGADGVLKKTGLDTKVTKLLQKKSENGSGTTTVADSKISGDNTSGVVPNRTVKPLVDPSTNVASLQRTQHILHGDVTGGGHLWPGLPGKTPFPKDWDANKVMATVSDIATNPKLLWKPQTGNGGLYTKSGKPARFIVTDSVILPFLKVFDCRITRPFLVSWRV